MTLLHNRTDIEISDVQSEICKIYMYIYSTKFFPLKQKTILNPEHKSLCEIKSWMLINNISFSSSGDFSSTVLPTCKIIMIDHQSL